MSEGVRTLTADRGDAGRRLDLVLRRHLRDIHSATRTRVQHWICSGLVTINGAPVTRVSTRTAPGDIVQIAVPEDQRPLPMRAEAGSLAVLYEDDDLMAVDKPAGVVVHPTYRNTARTVMNTLLWYARDWPPGKRPSLVGRLDKQTSGLLLVAKSSVMHRRLQELGESGCLDKNYLAVVHGHVRDSRAIDLPLGHDPRDRRRIVVAADGARSLTLVDPLATNAGLPSDLSAVRCRLVTGRTHQIRVHLASTGCPLVGDPIYGDANSSSGTLFPRQALHAWRVAFAHPVSGQRLSIEAPVPADMQHLLDLANLVISSAAGDWRHLDVPMTVSGGAPALEVGR